MPLLEFRLPDVGEGLDEGEVVAWLVAAGDTVRRDQPLVELQTDKSMVELPSPVAGRVVSLAASPGDIVKVGAILVVLDPADPADPAGSRAPAAVPSRSLVPPAPVSGADGTTDGRKKAPPSVRKLALELGVELATVTGTGPGGRILAADVQAAAAPAAAPVPAPAAATTRTVPAPPSPGGLGQIAPGRHPLRGVRRATAAAMARSWAEIPHLSAMDELDATALLEARQDLAAAGAGTGLTTLLVAACAQALRRFPLVNASLDSPAGEIVVHEHCHVGLAVATDAGLIVPVVRHADARSLAALEAEVRRLVAAARSGRIALDDTQGGTFTVTNYGSLGGRFATPVIRPPEAAILGFGAIRPRPFVLPDGSLASRPTLPYCLSADHRLVDGDLATAFAEHVASLLAHPVRLLAGVPGR